MQLPTVYVAPDKRYKNKDGQLHLKLWVTFKVYRNGKKAWSQVPYTTGHFATLEDAELILAKDKPRRADLQKIRSKLREIEARAEHLIETYQIYDQKRFELFYNTTANLESVAGQFQIKINSLKSAKPKPKISSAEKYRTAISSLIDFSHKDLTFHEITEDWLQDYEAWYIKADEETGKARSITSVGINLRCLRHIFKQAIRQNLVASTLYPFGMGQYVIPEGGSEQKNHLDPEEKDLFVTFRDPDDAVTESHDYCLFSYYGNGLNFSDIARLKIKEVFPDYVSREREKSKGRKKKIKYLVIPMHPRMKEIIQRHGKKSLNPNDYVFPILEPDMDEEKIFKTIRKFVKRTNDHLKVIFEKLNLSEKATTYTMRHTYSAIMMENGATTEDLQDALGHGSKTTTENYKHGLSLKKKQKFSEGL